MGTKVCTGNLPSLRSYWHPWFRQVLLLLLQATILFQVADGRLPTQPLSSTSLVSHNLGSYSSGGVAVTKKKKEDTSIVAMLPAQVDSMGGLHATIEREAKVLYSN